MRCVRGVPYKPEHYRFRRVLRPVRSGMMKRGSGHSSQEVRPWNSFTEPTGEEAFLPREGVHCEA
jgi:hypothetical protein